MTNIAITIAIENCIWNCIGFFADNLVLPPVGELPPPLATTLPLPPSERAPSRDPVASEIDSAIPAQPVQFCTAANKDSYAGSIRKY